MKWFVTILICWGMLFLLPAVPVAQQQSMPVQFEFYGEPVHFTLNSYSVPAFPDCPTDVSINEFFNTLQKSQLLVPAIHALHEYKRTHNPDDWIYYQLVRKMAEQISPKNSNYNQYTLYKWFFLTQTGYDALLTVAGDKILFYVYSNENIYNIPHRIYHGKQYVCLNFHDYGAIDFSKEKFTEVTTALPLAVQPFSYKVSQLPDFSISDYQEKDLHFSYYQNDYHFRVKLTPQIQKLFANYPVVDYESYLNIPLSKYTYTSLIPILKKNVKGLNTKNGVDYLMRFTRNAFLFESDTKNFGAEKRLSPEQTLLFNQSDCEDRVALFFCLVKEIYNLPMIVLAYPSHVTIAVEFDHPVGEAIVYNGVRYSVCEPTPQKTDLGIGQLLPELSKLSYEVAYVYTPR